MFFNVITLSIALSKDTFLEIIGNKKNPPKQVFNKVLAFDFMIAFYNIYFVFKLLFIDGY